ncbi:NAD(P)/FAD-dependent oxidoreductase [Roseicella sp. DB1501]|uniref:NAD(P)/FAD-dependent oxidoreductase n=1 Tax=Roseicella sp. DB1501 TaxID=2730925 RepID=UPI0014914376|nr:NAD(P)/FAD-dependent oxidoreductase [Roseicella sp. DB1501]NOG73304.1 NAD(P)-binding protein [Roseicella sp. DB1501]
MSRDRALGMDRPIPRRDLLQGAAALALGGAAPAAGLPDPPLRQGLRGSQPGSFEAMHALAAGAPLPSATDTEGPYDLVVVGAGISGLAAALFWRDARPEARILILDNHDDFGGHARRNEYRIGTRTLLMNGGTMLIDSPRPYGAVAAGLLRRLGIEPEALAARHADPGFWRRQGMGRGVFLDHATFGADHLLTGIGDRPWAEVLRDSPLPSAVQQDIARLHEARTDYLPGLSSAGKKALLARTSYHDYLARIAGAGAATLPFFQAMSHGEWGVGADAVSALDVWALGFPGFQGLDLAPGAAAGMGYTAAGYAEGGSARFHFPDGNASIARLLVRALIPQAVPGGSVEDVVLARADYARLDRPEAATRLRLESPVLRVRQAGDAVELTYLRHGEARRVVAARCVLACWGMTIPHLCPDLPEAQAAALRSQVKVPLVYVSVLLRNWLAFRRLGIARAQAPGSRFTALWLDWKTRIGGYDSIGRPEEPVLLFLSHVPTAPGLDQRAQHRAGRAAMLATTFEEYERDLRDELQRLLSAGGFEAARDILGITVNRWPHGYAYEYNPLFDPAWPPGEAPHEIGRRRFGRIAIANSDAGAAAYTDSAIHQAHRAVTELLAD